MTANQRTYSQSLLVATAALLVYGNLSCFATDVVQPDLTGNAGDPSQSTLSWNSEANFIYFVESTNDLTNWSWQTYYLATGASLVELTFPTTTDQAAYRLQYTEFSADNPSPLLTGDFDADGISNFDEISTFSILGLDVLNADSDGNGTNDGAEDSDTDFVHARYEFFFGFSDDDNQDVITNILNNTLNGSSSGDQLYGGIGNDVQFGGAGDDIYYWYFGDGNDFASDSSGENFLQFGEGITPAEISYERGNASSNDYTSNWVQDSNGVDLKIDIQHPTNSGLSGSFIIDGWSSYLDHWSIRFNDGTVIDGERLKTPINDIIRGTTVSETLDGLSGDDIIYGEFGSVIEWGDDTLIGGTGNDQCYGAEGIDHYVWNFGDGHDFYQDSSSFYASHLFLDGAITSADLVFEYGNVTSSTYLTSWTTVEGGSDLRITINNSDAALSGSIVIDNWTGSKHLWQIYIGEVLYLSGSVLASQMNDDMRGSGLIADNLDGREGSDIIYGYGLNDLLSGNSGDDDLYGGEGDDGLDGGTGDDQLYGENGDDTLMGDEGNDLLNAGYGIDQLEGGHGDDLLYGSYNDDTYTWNLGDGNDYISDNSGISSLVFGAGIDASDLSFDYGNANSSNYIAWQSVENGADLRITINDADSALSGSVVIESWTSYKGNFDIYFETGLYKNGNRLATELADSLNGSNSLNDSISGLSGNDTINGNDGNDNLDGNQGDDVLNGNNGDDALNGGDGNDTLNGGNGTDIVSGGPGDDVVYGNANDDVYVWNYGDGHDYFYETGDSNNIQFGSGITFSDLSFERGNVTSADYTSGWTEVATGADLRITINNATPGLSGSIVIENWTSYKDHWNIYFDNVLYANGSLFGTLVDDTLSGTGAADNIYGDQGNDTINGNNGNDTVSGGPGNDLIYGNADNDTYVWNYGDGHDYFYETGGSNDIQFGSGITFSDLSFERGNVTSADYISGWTEVATGADLRVTINNATPGLSGSIVIENWTSYKDHWNIYFDNVLYANGNLFGTLVDDSLSGTSIADNMSGYQGDDTLNGNDGDDTLNGDDGNDVLNGNNGNDTLNGSNGNDTLNGGNGNDTVTGGPGDDVVYGNADNDTYVWNYGDGHDYFYETGGSNDIQFGSGIAFSDLSFERGNVTSADYISGWTEVATGADLRITINNADAALSGSIVIESWTSYKDHWNIYFDNVLYANGNLFGTLVDDTLQGTSGDDSMFGNQGNDTLNGDNGDDTLNGGEDNDTLNGSYGDDYFIGGTEDDIANGGHGLDVFVWDFGDGEDFYYGSYRAGYYKTIRFGPGITPAMVTIENDSVSSSNYLTAWLDDPSGSDRKFIITHSSNDPELSGSIVIDAWTSYGGYWRIEFEDGSGDVWAATSFPDPVIINGSALSETINGDDGDDDLQGGPGDDRIYGDYGADLICGDEGDDYIDTHEGDDTVCWDFGDGYDFVIGTYFTGEIKKIMLASGITAEDITFEKGDITSAQFLQFQMDYWVTSPIGSDLRIIITHPTNPALSGSIIIDNWNSARNYWNIHLDGVLAWIGSMLSTEGNDSLAGLSSNDSIDGKAGNDSINGNDGDDIMLGGPGNDILDGGYGDDTLEGGPGNDQVYGSYDSDVYVWDFGDGDDFYDDGFGANQLHFGAAVDLASLSYELGEVSVSDYQTNWQSLPTGSDLRIFVAHSSNSALSGSIVINNWFGYKDHWDIFLNGQLLAFGGTLATPSNDTLTGTSEAEIILGDFGNDIINGNDGEDTLNGNEGNDTLNGGNQNDQLLGGTGNDTLNGGNGDDTLDSGAGFDLMYGGANNDLYFWKFGDGYDFIADNSGFNRIDLVGGIEFSHLSFDRGNVSSTDYYSNWVSIPTGSDLKIIITHSTNPSLSGSIVIDSWFSYRSQWSLYIEGSLHVEANLLGTNLADELLGSNAEDDSVLGLANNDILRGYAGNDFLYGGTGNDTLYGGNGDDTLDSGAGFDLMYGEANDDFYLWQFGDEHDFIADTSGSNVVNLTGGISFSNLSFDRGEASSSDYYSNWISSSTGPDLKINITHPTDASLSGSIVIDSWFIYIPQWTLYIDDVLYANAGSLATDSSDDLRGFDTGNDLINGLAGDDIIRGYAGDDSLNGDSGDDTLYGGNGNDMLDSGAGFDLMYGEADNDEYLWEFGDGHDFIADTSGDNFISFINSIEPSHLSFDRGAVSASDYYSNWSFSPTGPDLKIIITHPTDTSLSGSIVIDSWFSYRPQWSLYINNAFYLDAYLLATGLADELLGSDLEDDTIYGLAGNDIIYGYLGKDVLYGDADNDTLYGGSDDDQLLGGPGNDILYGENHNDVLDSGAGNDLLYGGNQNDTYLWKFGDGHDFISDSSGNHTLIFDSEIQAANLSFDRGFCSANDYLNSWSSDASGTCLRIIITHPSDNSLSGSVTIASWTSYRQFWTLYLGDSIYSTGLLLVTQFADDLRGTNSDLDNISGADGNDILYGFDRNDTLNGGNGNDTLYGGEDNDILNGNSGNDTLNGENGDDTLNGGLGYDIANGGHGVDQYIWNYGDGHDYFNDNSGVNDIRFGEGILAAHLSFEYGSVSSSDFASNWQNIPTGSDLRIVITHPTTLALSGSIVIENWSSYKGLWDIYLQDAFYVNGARLSTIYDDVLSGSNDQNDNISGLSGNDTISGDYGDDTFYGNEGNDTLSGGNDDDTLHGNEDNDTLNGGNGNDHLHGEIGNDLVYGGNDSDAYYWNYGDGHDYYSDGAGANELQFGANIDFSKLSFERGDASSATYLNSWSANPTGPDLRITVSHPTDINLSGSIVIESWTSYKDHWNLYFNGVLYANGNNLTTNLDDTVSGSSEDDLLEGLAGNDVLIGGYGDDQFTGGTGNDIANGGHGFDIFFWNLGDGEDFYSGDYRAGYYKTLRFGPDITPEMVSTEYDSVTSSNYLTEWQNDPAGSDRKLIITNTDNTSLSGSIVIDAWTSYGGYWRIEFANGEVWDVDPAVYPDSVNIIGDATDETINGNNGADNIQGGAGDDSISGAYGNDTLSGDEGFDLINVGYGSDTAVWNLGDEHDFVLGSYFTGEKNILRLGPGITPDMLSFEKGNATSADFLASQLGAWTTEVSGSDLRVIVTHSTNPSLSGSIIIDNWNSYRSYWQIEFTDNGTIYSGNTLATQGNDAIAGTSGDDFYQGDAGDDTLNGDTGNDTLFGNQGNDVLNGDNGNDLLHGEVGNDQVYGGSNDDAYYWSFGDGQDYFYDTDGVNTLVLDAGITKDNLQIERGDDVNASTYISGWTVNLDGPDLRISITHPSNSELSGSIVINAWTQYNDHWQIQFPSGEIIFGTLLGTDGNDTLTGSEEVDLVEGGLSNDYSRANGGDDVYIYNLNDGLDIWEDNQGLNTIRFGSGITPDMLSYLLYNVSTTLISEIPVPVQYGEDLGITVTDNGSTAGFVVVNDWIYNTLNWRIEFTAVDPNTGQVYPAIERTQFAPEILPWDFDNDSIPDWWERQYGLDTTVGNQGIDTDGDGLLDLEEFNAGSSPLLSDTDNDLLPDYVEVTVTGTDPSVFDDLGQDDLDGDGISTADEINIGSDIVDFDSNNDGISDGVTYALGLDPTSPDPDGDGLSTEQEQLLGTSTVNSDTDGDGSPDNIDPNPTDPNVFLTSTNGDTTAPDITLILPTPN